MLNSILSAILPAVLLLVGGYAVIKNTDLFAALTEGGMGGLKSAVNIIPSLVVLLTAIFMLRASGAFEAFTDFLRPVASFIGIPAECLPIALIRPLSGSGAIAMGADVISTYGVDSAIGRTAAVMLGSTETTFYVISVYFGSAGISKTRYAIPAALTADLVGFIMSAVTVRLFF